MPVLPPRFSDLQKLPIRLPLLPPEIRVGYRADLEWEGCRKLRLISIPGSGCFGASCRGRYTLISQMLVLEDFCGLFRCCHYGQTGDRILIYPAAEAADLAVFPDKAQVPEREVLYTPLKNQDYFESRPYYSGDDPRRINWKMMARHGELFIREGSGCLPSRGRVLLLLDPGEDALRFGSLGSSVSPGDILLRHAATLIRELGKDGCRIDMAAPGVAREGVEALSETAIQDILAVIPPGKLWDKDISFTENPADIVYFLSSGTPDRDILKRFGGSGPRVLVIPRRGSSGLKGKKGRDGNDYPGGWDIAYS